MPRCSHDDVTAILSTNVNVEPFIIAASAIIDHHLATAGLSATLLKELERWLAAHLACVRDPLARQISDSDTSVTFERGTPGTGLDATSYGQQVRLLDPTGLLAQALTTRRASIRVD